MVKKNILPFVRLGVLCFLFMSNITQAQTKTPKTLFGVQVKPIVPFSFLNTGSELITGDGIDLQIDPKVGFNIGMVIRHRITDVWSLETGLNYVARKYDFDVLNDSIPDFTERIRFEGYEIPVSGMVFLRLGDQIYGNVSLGVSLDLYPTGGLVANNEGYEIGILERKWIQTAFISNLGVEWRTKKSGYLYIGSSFHQPFTDMADVLLSYREEGTNNFDRIFEVPLNGSYLTIDLRYFFFEKSRQN